MAELFCNGRIELRPGDCRDIIKAMPDNSIDSVVTDPPYALVSIVKRFGGENSKPANDGDVYARASSGFMGKQWDTGETAFAAEFWAEVLRVLKPGGHVVAFGGDRTFHRLAVAIEDAGFEVRGSLAWLFGSGFPKSHNVSAKLEGFLPADVRCACALDCSQTIQGSQSDYLAGRGYDDGQLHADQVADLSASPSQADALKYSPFDRRVDGLGEAPSRSHLHSSDRLSSEGSRGLSSPRSEGFQAFGSVLSDKQANKSNGESKAGHKTPIHKSGMSHSGDDLAVSSSGDSSVSYPNLPHCPSCGKVRIPLGLGTALKPAMELICLARKPLIGTVAANVLEWGTGALNIDATRVGTDGGTAKAEPVPSSKTVTAFGNGLNGNKIKSIDAGRWPANIVHDGSDEVLAGFKNDEWRYFYTSKADKGDRLGFKHPTVKPVDLMQWLVRMVTPKGGVVLDPFAGTGSTGEAAFYEGMRCILCEREVEYQANIRRRMELAEMPAKRAAVAVTKDNLRGAEGTPLFGWNA